MVESYKEMTLGQLLQIKALKDADITPAVQELSVLSILSGITIDALRKVPKADYDAMLQKIAFLTEDNSETIEIADEVELNGTVYNIWHDIKNITTGQYIDWCSYMQSERDIVDLFSCFVIPKGKLYAEGYNIDKAKEDIHDLPMPIANFISFFWQSSLALYLERSARELETELKKMEKKMNKMMRAHKSR